MRKLTFRYNYSHSAQVGHELKSRALENLIYCNRISDEADGTASYLIDLPNGGRSFVIGNILHKGPRAQNNVMLSYAEEGAKNPLQELYVINNTMVNQRNNGTAVRVAGTPTVLLVNNLLTGSRVLLAARAGSAITCSPAPLHSSTPRTMITTSPPAPPPSAPVSIPAPSMASRYCPPMNTCTPSLAPSARTGKLLMWGRFDLNCGNRSGGRSAIGIFGTAKWRKRIPQMAQISYKTFRS